MKLSDWANIAEVVSGIAVVVTLVILVIGIRENTVAIQASSRQSIASRIEERAMSVATNREMAELLARSTRPGTLDIATPEGIQIVYFFTSVMSNMEEAYLQYHEGNLDQAYLEARARRALAAMAGPLGDQFLAERFSESTYEPNFVQWFRGFQDQVAQSD